MQLTEALADRERRQLQEKLASQLFLSAPEAAALYRVDRRTLYRALENGEIPGIKVGVTWKIPTAWLRKQAGMGDGDAATA
jgi:excisionase family DNA binding protein